LRAKRVQKRVRAKRVSKQSEVGFTPLLRRRASVNTEQATTTDLLAEINIHVSTTGTAAAKGQLSRR
jgi:hypothetical protein